VCNEADGPVRGNWRGLNWCQDGGQILQVARVAIAAPPAATVAIGHHVALRKSGQHIERRTDRRIAEVVNVGHVVWLPWKLLEGV
jgi:hypothetical protein